MYRRNVWRKPLQLDQSPDGYYIVKAHTGESVLLDDAGLKILLDLKQNPKMNSTGYPFVTHRGKQVLLHRLVYAVPNGLDCDHINRNRSDCRASNLRAVTKTQNQWNRGRDAGGSSQYKGVFWNTRKQRWIAVIKAEGRAVRKHFTSERDAAVAYNEMALKYRPGFAVLNNV